ncbi:MAG: flagellar hook-associated protein FlgK [Granulosicoccus sp.]
MGSILSNGVTGLLAFQRALNTTSQNIANVNTEGYSRQRVDLESIVTNPHIRHQSGSGVRITGVERVHDEFATTQMLHTNSLHTRQDTHLNLASRVDYLMADDALSMTPQLNNFFSALQDANGDPASPASREIVLEQAEQLVNRFNGMQQELDGLQHEVNDRLQENISDVNEIASSISELNRRIVASRGSMQGGTPNELMDQRDKLINQLSSLVRVQTSDQEDGARNIFVGNGVALVVGTNVQQLRTSQDPVFAERLQIEVGSNNNWQQIGIQLQGGSIGGLRDFERDTLNPAKHQLGRLALTFADQLNQQHAMGRDLQGNAGTALFSVATPEISESEKNTGNGVITASIADTGALQASDYLLRYDGASFRTTRLSDGQQFNSPAPLNIDGLDITLSGTPAAGDTFLVSATGHAAAAIDSTLSQADLLALASPLATSSDLNNLGKARINPVRVLDATNTAFLDPVEIVFSADDRFDVIDTATGTTLGSNILYEPGTPVQFNGWEISIDGSASAGDTHKVVPDSAGNGSNNNGLALAELQNTSMINGTQTLNDAYGSLVSQMGGRTRTLQTRSDALETLKTEAYDRLQSVQGVSLDEEAVNLTRYQQAFQASAQVIAMADTLFQTILGAVAR